MGLAPPDLIRFAYLSLKGNPVRSLLSTIGVFMGVLAVSATLEARNLAQAFLARQLSQREAPQVTIYLDWSSDTSESIPLKPKDLQVLRQNLSGWGAISAQRFGTWNGTVLFEGQEAPGDLQPVSVDYLKTSGHQLLSGRFFTPSDIEKYRAVAVIDDWLATELFKGDTAIGKQIHTDNNSYQVIGVVNSLNEGWWESEPRGSVMISLAMDTAITGRDTLDNI
ncbi:MAG: ABC transporter permease [Merismopedia sp. SIO2A8]|nr:ABC transporter permease [Merismopedia sp. SIO2A8]